MSSTRVLPTLRGSFDSTVTVPGSKSITIRALTAAALATGRSHLYGALRADDTDSMIEVLRAFGVTVHADIEPWTVDGSGGRLTTPTGPLDVGLSALTLRITMVLTAMAPGPVTVGGRIDVSRRPIQPLIDVLTAQGLHVSMEGHSLPLTISGKRQRVDREIVVDSAASSQFVTALLLAAPVDVASTTIRPDRLEGSEGYLELTLRTMAAFGAEVERTITGYEVTPTGYQATDLVIEPDVSAAVYPMVAAAITGSRVLLPGLTLQSGQPDVVVAHHLGQMGCVVADEADGLVVDARGVVLQPIEADLRGAPDGALALVVACLFASGESRLEGLGTLRHKESDRISSIAEGLSALGAEVTVDAEALVIRPRPLRASVVDPHDDHRVAMSLALVGLCVEGVEVSHPEVVAKTWPGYWEAMTALASSVDSTTP